MRVTPHDRVATHAFLRGRIQLPAIADRRRSGREGGERTRRRDARRRMSLACSPTPRARANWREGFLRRTRTAPQRAPARRTRPRLAPTDRIDLEFGEVLSRAGRAPTGPPPSPTHTRSSRCISRAPTLTSYEHGKARVLLRELTPAAARGVRRHEGLGGKRLHQALGGHEGLHPRNRPPPSSHSLRALEGGPEPEASWRAYESPGDRVLLRRIRHLTQQHTRRLMRSSRATESLGKPLGIHSLHRRIRRTAEGRRLDRARQHRQWRYLHDLGAAGTCAGTSAAWPGVRDRARRPPARRFERQHRHTCVSRGAPEQENLRASCESSRWEVEGQTREGVDERQREAPRREPGQLARGARAPESRWSLPDSSSRPFASPRIPFPRAN